MVRSSLAAGLLWVASGTATNSDEVTMLHINQIHEEMDSMNMLDDSTQTSANGGHCVLGTEPACNHCIKADGYAWRFLGKNGYCNDGSQPCNGPSYRCRLLGGQAPCQVGTDCEDCGNCPGGGGSGPGPAPATTTQPVTHPTTPQTTTTTTGGINSHDNFDHGHANSNVCPAGSVSIRSPGNCQAAAHAVGLSYRGQENAASQPVGCYVLDEADAHGHHHTVVMFNGHVLGSGHANGRPLCSKPCDAASDCSGHGTTDDHHKDDGCTCECLPDWTGADCSNGPGPPTTPPPTNGNPTVIECGGIYAFEIESGSAWMPTLRAAVDQEVTLSTCGSGAKDPTCEGRWCSKLDTVIDGPCFNDDSCSLQSQCDYTAEAEETAVKIKAYGNNFGHAQLTVTCSALPTTTTTTEPTPTQAPDHPDLVHGHFNTNECPLGSARIEAANWCYAAANAIGVPYRGVENSQDKPIGCYVLHAMHGAEVWYNGHNLGSPHTHGTPLCAKPCYAEVDCNGRGTTVDDNKIDGCQCECEAPWTGNDCSVPPPCEASVDCHGHGETTDHNKLDGCTCTCTQNWRGEDCSIPPSCSSANHCNNHAVLSGNTRDGCVCDCANGWTGDDCSIAPVVPCDAATDCSGHGTTNDPNKNDANGCVCDCDEGWSGANCGTPPVPVCDASDCSDNGVTTDLDARDGCDCVCNEGFRGDDCSIPPACSSDNHCNGHATLDLDSSDGCVCHCVNGWSGDDCSVPPPCTEADCNNHGTTTDLDNRDGCSCTCAPTWTGNNCQTPPPCHHETHCHSHGTTEDDDASDGCVCSCTDEWRGEDCSIPPACSSENHCNGHAVLSGNTVDGCVCNCANGWTGDDCSTPPADGNPTHIECGGTYDFEIKEGGDEWRPTFSPAVGTVATLSTCGSTSRFDTVISAPCLNDDGPGCFPRSTCQTNTFTEADFDAHGSVLVRVHGYGRATGSSQLTVTCEGGEDPGPTPPTQPTTTAPGPPPVTVPTTQTTTTEPREGAHGTPCSTIGQRIVSPPSLAGGCQRCTCVSGTWQCACSLRHRKEVNDLTDVEFNLFAAALNRMASTGEWADVARTHAASDRQHYKTHMNNQTFLPWHRKFFVEVENRLQLAAKALGSSNLEACSVTIPYWNWALDATHFATATIWGANRLGSLQNGATQGDLDDQFCVNNGKFGKGVAGSGFGAGGSSNPFKGGWFGLEGCGQLNGVDACMEMLTAFNWRSWQVPCNNPQGTGAGQTSDGGCTDCILRRGADLRFLPSLNYAQMLTALKEHEAYQGVDNFPEMSNFLENQIHNGFHVAVGGQHRTDNGQRYSGHMMSMYSPYDPVFFFHHGFIDFLWSQWQDSHITGPWRDTSGGGHLLNNLLWDGNADVFPASDVALAMDIKDDDPTTDREENVCVKYHERETNHACAPQWTEIQDCFVKLVTYEKLHTVPRIRVDDSVGDICDPLVDAHWDLDRMWLETMVASGMMREEHIDQVLAWEGNQLQQIENTTEVLDAADATECDKALCFSTSRMLQICQACDADGVGWSLTCHCDASSQSTSCWESRN